jgi:hypothetical protein
MSRWHLAPWVPPPSERAAPSRRALEQEHGAMLCGGLAGRDIISWPALMSCAPSHGAWLACMVGGRLAHAGVLASYVEGRGGLVRWCVLSGCFLLPRATPQ